MRKISLNKGQLINKVVAGTGLNKRESTDVLNSVIKCIMITLGKGGTVKLYGFGNFAVVKRVAHKVLNPRTGKKITISARKVVKFKPGAQLIKELNVKSV